MYIRAKLLCAGLVRGGSSATSRVLSMQIAWDQFALKIVALGSLAAGRMTVATRVASAARWRDRSAFPVVVGCIDLYFCRLIPAEKFIRLETVRFDSGGKRPVSCAIPAISQSTRQTPAVQFLVDATIICTLHSSSTCLRRRAIVSRGRTGAQTKRPAHPRAKRPYGSSPERALTIVLLALRVSLGSCRKNSSAKFGVRMKLVGGTAPALCWDLTLSGSALAPSPATIVASPGAEVFPGHRPCELLDFV